MSKENHIIWTSEPDFDNWKEDLEAEHPDMTEDQLRELMYETNSMYLDDEKVNLAGIDLPNGILVFGTLGLWNGRKSGYLEHEPDRITECFQSHVRGMSDQTFYVTPKGEFCCEESHHDGTNFYTFRAWKPDVTEQQKDYLRLKIYNNLPYESTLSRLTYRLGDLIGDIYGWSFPNRPKAAKKKGA